MVTVSVDAMGGDLGPEVAIKGAVLAQQRFPDMSFIFYGNKEIVLALLQKHPALSKVSKVVGTPMVISMEHKPSQVLREGLHKSSMGCAIQAVKKGEADACVSPGNTGALMAMSYFCLKMMQEVERPGIAGVWPSLVGESIVLDIGATIGASAQQLVTLAVMGAGMFRVLYNVERPTVGLLNVGVEAQKGLEEIKEAGKMLREMDFAGLHYKGFVEGNDIGKGTVDVVVTEGFSGNIALKAAEGTARQIGTILKQAMGHSVLTRLGYLLSKSAFDIVRKKMDPSRVNGGVLLGLNGLVIKSHGNADAKGFASAFRVAYETAQQGLLGKIATDLQAFQSYISSGKL